MNTQTNNSNSTIFTIVASLCLALFCSVVSADQPVIEGTLHTTITPVVNATLRPVSTHDIVTTNNLNARPREEVDTFQTAAKAIDPQVKISSRYSDSNMLNFLRRTSMSELSSLYLEASRMIDARHVNPTSYEDRSKTAILGLINAVENETFLRANNANIDPTNVRTLQSELNQLAQGQPARNANEALGLMQWAAEKTNQRLGVRREAVALEFLNSTLDGLDNYSAFMPSETAYNTGALDTELRTAAMDFELTAGLEENIVGIGVEMKIHDNGALLTGVVENSPASDLGLQEGDVIIAVNQRSIAGQNLNQIADQVAGQAGTSLSVDIDRSGKKYRGTLTRRQIYVSSVSGTKMIDTTTRTGYIRLKQFSDSSTKDLEAALWTLHKQGMQSLILDLRGNPGGLLDQAITVSDLFVPQGTIVSTKGRNASDNTSETAHYEKTWSTPLVVLVDENSASASEIFGAAIQENGRGVIVGRTSYGKGTVQTHFPLQTVSAHLKLTTAKFYSPKGREMAGSGVTPDVAVNASANTTVTGYRGTNTDADISTALQVIQSGTPRQMLARATNQPVVQPINNNYNGGYGQVTQPSGSLR